ncbi:MAG: methyltransferase domain-containing protein [Candidatus Latescibacteria bacterium]|jgi:SAM-dependent methyltransferase|nr:methyltransferase domain-containing protein [Candidatus Latescibacterota bacterium]
MSILSTMGKIFPERLKHILRPIIYYRAYHQYDDKYHAEIDFWRSRFEIDQNTFENSNYQRILLAMAGEDDDAFLKGKIVADFGCGPRGSLAWADVAQLRIGIDVLADKYADAFTDDVISHGMVYLKSTERVIPVPSEFVDVLFTLNAIDHVDSFQNMCHEIVRILKPGGLFIGSFNLEEPPSDCEPQQLNETIIKASLLDKLVIQTYRVSRKGPKENLYGPFFDNELSYRPGEEGCLWVRAAKPSD